MQFAKGHQRGRDAKADGCTKVISAIGVAAISLVGSGGIAMAQTTTIQPGNAAEVTAATLSGDLKASQVIQDPGAPYENVFRDFNAGIGASPKLGPGNGRIQAGPFNLGANADTPLTRGFKPEEAELKLGNFYLDIRELRASLLYSDNAKLSETNREGDVMAAITLGLTGMYQVTEGLRIAVSGAVIYLPLDNRIGLQGFGLVDPFARFELDGGTLARAQVVYDFILGKWQVVVYDDFRVLNRTGYRLGEEEYLDLYDGESFNSNQSFRSHEVYSGQRYQSPQFQDTRQNTDRFDFTAIDYINTVGVIGERLVTGNTLATVSYEHNNYWYSTDSQTAALVNRASTSDRFLASLRSQRENLRFKPFITYVASTSDLVSGWDQQITGGVNGPITDQLDFHAEAGYIFSGNSSRETWLWRTGVRHYAGPLTTHGLLYYRVLTEPERLMAQRLEYSLAQILGPYLIGGLVASHGKYEDLDNGNSLITEDRLGAYLNYNLGEFGNLSFAAFYSALDFTNPASSDYNLLTLRLSYNVALGEKTNLQSFYQFEKRDADQAGQSYYENLVGISLSYTF